MEVIFLLLFILIGLLSFVTSGKSISVYISGRGNFDLEELRFTYLCGLRLTLLTSSCCWNRGGVLL